MLTQDETRKTLMGYYTDEYFLRSRRVLKGEGLNPDVVVQVFAKKNGILCGIKEINEMLHQCAGDVEWYTQEEGSRIESKVPVLYIKGPYRDFAHIETPLLGVLARRSLVATNARDCVDAAKGNPVIFMGARHDDFRIQKGDGYAARIGGVESLTTKANCEWLSDDPVGTMPHSLIAAMGGDVAKATVAFHRQIRREDPDVRTISLVDYNNDCVEDSISTAESMKEEFGPDALFAVRLDTSESMIDKSLQNTKLFKQSFLKGVNTVLVRKVRKALDKNGFENVKIVVSGGFDSLKIHKFEKGRIPVDAYGVGSSILKGSFDFTADIVYLRTEKGWKPESKEGRKYIENPGVVSSNLLLES